MPVIDLRKQKLPETPKLKTQAESDVAGLSRDEILTLQATGWKPGEKIPPDLLKSIREHNSKADFPIKPTEGFKTFDQLSPEEQKKLVSHTKIKPKSEWDKAQYVKFGDEGAPADPTSIPGVDPALVALMKLGQTAQVPPEPKKEEPKLESTSSGGEVKITNCPHCGWKVDDLNDPDPSSEDKLSFVQAVLGGTRFKKRYDFFDGNLVIVFRSLSTLEADVAFTQTAYDARQNGFLDEGQYFRTLMDYRLCMGIESIASSEGKFEVPETLTDDFKTDKPPKNATKLTYIVPYIYETVLKTENLRRTIGAAFYRFQRLVEKLEVRADDPNFWKATEGQRY